MTPTSLSDSRQVSRGRVYVWLADRSCPRGGRIQQATVSLPRLTDGTRLSGRFVEVHNAGAVHVAGRDGSAVATPLHDARADLEGNFFYEPGIGGGRLDKVHLPPPETRDRYIHAARFGEVNTYYHVDRIASYVDGLLQTLGDVSLPKVVVRVNAHHAATGDNGCRDGVRGKQSGRWLPFQGGHYRLPTKQSLTVKEHHPLSANGEIHLGPGWRLTEFGALPEHAGRRYRCNASHNAGIIYHEYGHHITRHTADFRANRLRAPHRQNNLKTDTDEAYSDYWAATMLDCPHIWALHRRHDQSEVHPRSLTSSKTMADYDFSKSADPHLNGTILAATLWDLRTAFQMAYPEGTQRADLLVLQSLQLLGRLGDHPYAPSVPGTRRLRAGFSVVLLALLRADRQLHGGQHGKLIEECFARRGIACPEVGRHHPWSPSTAASDSVAVKWLSVGMAVERIRTLDPLAIIPAPNDLYTGPELEHFVQSRCNPAYSVIGVGDIMLGSRARRRLQKFGPDYPFHAVRPLFDRSHIVLGNLEGPLAKRAEKQPRNHSYKVDPRSARALRRAGINVMTLANNHVLDCGREGVLESLAALKKHGIACIGAGTNRDAASRPAILQAGKYRVGLLGYYWNRRTSARRKLPGSARDTPEQLVADIRGLRPLVDRIVVTFHWGVPYLRDPSYEVREKARLAIALGADVVIGHHPHIIQPFEIFQNRPIFYSLGNFAFGTGNSRAESLLLAVRFRERTTDVDVYPAYVKNRDPRVDYQPKIMAGAAAVETLQRLADLSDSGGGCPLEIVDGIGQLRVPLGMSDGCYREVSVVQD